MIVVDTNIILSAFRSRNGASSVILSGMLTDDIEFAATPAVIYEYEDVLKRSGLLGKDPWILPHEIDIVLDAICARAVHIAPVFRFRPFLDDPKDDLFIECALTAGAKIIVTDDKHFNHPAVAGFGLKKVTAPEFIALLNFERKPS